MRINAGLIGSCWGWAWLAAFVMGCHDNDNDDHLLLSAFRTGSSHEIRTRTQLVTGD